jgi:hypothetical protein
VGCIACSQRLYAVFERPSKISVAPDEIAVAMNPDWLKATRSARRDDVLQNAKKKSTGVQRTKKKMYFSASFGARILGSD